MAEEQPPAIVEGATTGDVEDELPPTAKSAEDRKAASALASLDNANDDSSSGSKQVDQDAVSKAMKSLGGSAKPKPAAKEVKNVKVDAADVALLVDELDLPRPKATELLKAHDGDAVKAMRAFVAA